MIVAGIGGDVMLLHLAIPVSDQIVVPVELNIEIYRISKGQKKNQHHQPQWQKNPSNMNQQLKLESWKSR